MISLTAENCSSTLSNKITGSLIGRNCILFCKLTVCTSLTVFLWMWLTRILVIWIQNLWQDVSNREYLKETMFTVGVISSYYTVLKYLFLLLKRQGEINSAFLYTVTLIVWPHKISPPTSIVMKVTVHFWITEEKNKLIQWVIITMIRLTWHIQKFRRILIRSAMKYY